MRRNTFGAVGFSFLITLLVTLPSLASAANSDPFRSGRDAVSPKPSIGVSQSSGAMTYSYPLVIPPGRNGVQPNLSLNYSSDDKRQDSPFGYGWSMNLPYIERVNKLGTNNLYNQDKSLTFFTSSLSGDLLPLSSTTTIGSFLGMSESTPLLAYLDASSEVLPYSGSNPVAEVAQDATEVTANIARMFHSFADTFLPTHVYHPNEWEEWNNARKQTTAEAKKSIPGFPNGEKQDFDDGLNEIMSERTATSRVFVEKTGGRERMIHRFYGAPIFYKNLETGEFEDIDSRIEEVDGGFSMKKAPYKADVDTSGAKPLVTLTYEGQTITLDSPNKNPGNLARAYKVDDHTIRYPDLIGPGLDLELITRNNNFIENVVITGPQAGATPDGDYIEIPFTVRTSNFNALSSSGKSLSESATLTSSDEATLSLGNAKARILAPTAISSASGAKPTSIEISYTKNGDGTIAMKKRIPKSFLDGVTYPVRTDATFSFNPAVGDGTAYHIDTSWSAARDTMSGGSGGGIPDGWYVTIENDKTGASEYRINRSFLPFDTSSLPDNAIIQSATLNVWPAGRSLHGDSYDYLAVVGPTTQSSTSWLYASDFAACGATSSPTYLSNTTATASTYWPGTATTSVQFLLNASGIAAISKTGYTKLGIREGHDIDNVSPPSQATRYWSLTSADNGNGEGIPYLDVISGTPPSALQVESLTNPSNISTSSPRFSAVYENASSSARASSYQIQVSTTSSFGTGFYWDSGKMTLSSSTPPGMRSPQIFSTSTFAVDGKKYYWRIRFWDQYGGVESWSDSGDYFVMQMTGEYAAKVDDGSMMRYTLQSDGSWIAYDKRGWKYTFGATSNARINDPDNSAKVYRWYLEEVADPNGNKVLYRYSKDNGQVYPDYIDYTDRQGGSLFEVDFTKDFCDTTGSPCAPFATSSIYGFPVFTRYLVSDMTAAVNGIIVRRFTPTYKYGDNSSRLLLSAITEKGYSDGNGTGAITYPSTNFTYQTSTTTWTEVTDPNFWQMTFDVSDNSNNDYGWRMFDVNGDSLPDWVKSDGSAPAVLLNNGTKWATSTAWTVPVAFAKNNVEQGVRMAEVNGDGLVDIIAASTTKTVYLNNGMNTWVASSTWVFPESFIDSGNRDRGVQIVDFNGDNLADVIRAYYSTTTGTTTGVYINNGHGWTQDTGWTVPEVFIQESISSGYLDPGTRLHDYNGDGLVDLLLSNSVTPGTKKVYVNTGYGFRRDTALALNEYFSDGSDVASADNGYRFADINGDGRVDFVKALASNPRTVFIGGATGYTSITGTFPDDFQNTSDKEFGTRMDDINGDGQIDVVRSYYDAGTGSRTRKVYIKNGEVPDLLREVSTSRKGKTTTGYQGSAEYKDGSGVLTNPNLPFVTQTVRTLTIDNGSYLMAGRVIATTTYDYQRGYYYGTNTPVLDRKFAGFGLVTETSPLGAYTKTYFHQGNPTTTAETDLGEYGDHISKIGKPYRIEVYDPKDGGGNEHLLSLTLNKWGRADYGDGRNFVKLGQTKQSLHTGGAGSTAYRMTADTMTYDDAKGNLTQRIEYGEVTGNESGAGVFSFTDTDTKYRKTDYTYAASSTLAAMSLPLDTQVRDDANNLLDATYQMYDNASWGNVISGNVTEDARYIDNYKLGRCSGGAWYTCTKRTFDVYGNVSTSTDQLGNSTGFTYDGYNLFPTTVRNALNQQKLFSFDYSSGKAATSTDENNQTFVTVFDNLDRPTEEKQPDFITPSTLVSKTTYSYVDSTTTPASIFRKDYLSSATTTDSYSYFDGFDRVIQTKREAESANGWITKDTLFNLIGKTGSESLPYFNSTNSWSNPTTTTALFLSFGYDGLGRTTAVVNILGTTTNIYDRWSLAVLDPLGNKKDLNKDGYGNLAEVVEYLTSTSSATTTYAWDLSKNLTKITDAAGNIRNFTYDTRNRLLKAEDLHAPADTSFGSTTRAYNDGDLLATSTNAKGDIIVYAYDVLNRVVSENALATAALLDVAYRYDTCTNGKGRLCEVNANNAATTTYAYNPLGLVGTTSSQASGAWATTSTRFFRNSSPDTIVYPDNHQIAYIYNDAGDPNRVLGLTPGTTTWSTLVESMGYNPLGQPTLIDYGNNTKTTNTYDATKLYRLTQKLTVSTSTVPSTPEKLLFLSQMLGVEEIPLLDLEINTTTLSTIDNLLDSVGTTSDILDVGSPNIAEEKTLASVMDTPVPSDLSTSSIRTIEDSESGLVRVASSSEIIIDKPAVARTLSDTIKDLPAAERANAKAVAVTSLGSIPRTVIGENSIEIISIEPIDGGVQVFARAWDVKGDQIGFGKDGSIDIERFRIINPPILVPDGTTHEVTDDNGNIVQVPNYKEDLRAALLKTLEHIISVKTEKFSGENIVSGKIGRTTTTIFPNPDPESTSVDGYVWNNPGGGSWSSLVTAGSGTGAGPSSSFLSAGISSGNTTDSWALNTRFYFLFDTSSIPDGNTISSSTLSVWINAKGDSLGITPSINVYSSSPASSTNLVNADYSAVGSTTYSTSKSYSSVVTGAYANFALNANGIAAIDKAGVSKFSIRNNYDVTATAPVWSSSLNSFFTFFFAERTGTTNDPMLVVEHSVYSVPASVLQDLRYSYDVVGNITQVLDLSGTNSYASTSYQYDNLYRLIRASTTDAIIGNWLQTYSYDNIGNFTNKSDVGAYTYAGTNYANPHAATAINGVTHTYDMAGNLTNYGSTYLSWDQWNRLVNTNVNGTTTHYTYDHSGQRVTQSVKMGAGATTTTTYWNRYFQKTGATSTISVYLPSGELLGVVEGNGVSTSTFIAHTDHLNSATVMSDKKGGLAQLTTYYPYGAVRQNEKGATGFNSQRKFLSQFTDDSTSFNFLQARYEDGAKGRFLSEDPVFLGDPAKQNLANPQTLNSYAYGNGNPIRYSDPSGLAVTIDPFMSRNLTLQLIGLQLQVIQLQLQQLQQQALAAGKQAVMSYIDPISAYQSATNPSLSTTQRTIAATAGIAGVANVGKDALTVGVAARGLVTRATEIHGVLDMFAQTRRTTAVLQTDAGNIVAGGAVDLTKRQIGALKPGEIPVSMFGAHAEVTAITGAKTMGSTPQMIGVSRPICLECQAFIESTGGTITGPNTAVWANNF